MLVNKEFVHNIKNKLFVATCGIEKVQNELSKESINRHVAQNTLTTVNDSLNSIVDLMVKSLNLPNVSKTVLEIITETVDSCSYMPLVFFHQARSVTNKVVSVDSLENLLINIFKNAVEAKSSKIYINIDGHKLHIFDDGGGIEESVLDDIRKEKYFTDKPNGSGIGISSIVNNCKKNGWLLEIKNIDIANELKGLSYKITMTES